MADGNDEDYTQSVEEVRRIPDAISQAKGKQKSLKQSQSVLPTNETSNVNLERTDKTIVSNQVDWANLFPATRIKNQLQQNEQVGRIRNSAAALAGACAGLLLEKLRRRALEMGQSRSSSTNANKQQPVVVSLPDVQQAAADYPFLESVLEDLSEETAPRIQRRNPSTQKPQALRKRAPPAKTKPPPKRAKPSQNPSSFKQIADPNALQAAAAASTILDHPTQTIDEDEDDYD